MADVEFSSADLTALAAKLDTLADRLSERERALLLATFQMAGDQLNQLSGAGGNLESTGFATPARLPAIRVSNVEALPSLSAGFRDSFVRGGAGGVAGAGLRPNAVEWDASVSVMGGGMGG